MDISTFECRFTPREFVTACTTNVGVDVIKRGHINLISSLLYLLHSKGHLGTHIYLKGQKPNLYPHYNKLVDQEYWIFQIFGDVENSTLSCRPGAWRKAGNGSYY